MTARGFQLLPERASALAGRVDALYAYLWTVTAVFTLLIFLLVAYFGIKYRRRREDEPAPRPTAGSVRLELFWAMIPLVFGMSFFFWGARLYIAQYQPPDQTLDIHVIGKQWMWKAQHPSGVREINSLHVPLGRPVRLILASQDVIHSFYLPAFRTKMDAVPGRYTTMWFQPDRVGEYHIFCAEYCGTLHSGMRGALTVMEPEDYEAWLAGAPAGEPPAAAGWRLFQSLGCVTCHAAQAPSMAGLYMSEQTLADGSTVVADENYLRRSILDSTSQVVAGYQPIMPSYRGQVTEEQLAALIAYIVSLRDARAGEPSPPPPAGPDPGGLPPLRPPAPTGQREGGAR